VLSLDPTNGRPVPPSRTPHVQWPAFADLVPPPPLPTCHPRPYQLAPRSLFLFTEANKIRQCAVALMLWKWFDRFIIAVILLNSVFMGLTDYSLSAVDPVTLEPDGSRSWRNALSSVSEPYFTAVFALEAVVKIVAMGFVMDPGSYLQDKWNW
jgi:hypothetical protein